MRAMILAAGRGERMRPLTDTIPKPLLQVAGRPLLAYHLEALKSYGITDIVINYAWLGEQIEQTFGNGEAYGVNIRYSPEQPGGLETGGGIFQALPMLGDEPFIVINGDIWTDFPLQALPKRITGLAHLVMVPNPDHHPNGDFGLIDGVVNLDKTGRLTYSGIGIYSPIFFHDCEEGRFPLAPLLRKYIARGQVTGQIYQGEWSDVGTPERLVRLNNTVHL